jgi:hypothetical protein
MSTNTPQRQVQIESHRRRKKTKAERRKQDRALVPAGIAGRVGMTVADLAKAMRGAGVTAQLTWSDVDRWKADPDTAPEWFTTLVGEKLARDAEAEFRRQQVEEAEQMRELATEQSAWDKVLAGNRNFNAYEWWYVEGWAYHAAKDLVRNGPEGSASEEERAVLRAARIDADNHQTWPMHMDGCDGYGRQHCVIRIDEVRFQRRVDSLLTSVEKETTLRDLGLAVGDTVTTWHGARAGKVVKINKVTVKVRMIGPREEKNAVIERNLDPRYVQRAPDTLPAAPSVGDTVTLRDHGGFTREAQVVAVDGPLFEATYALKSKQWRSGWFDVVALRPGN